MIQDIQQFSTLPLDHFKTCFGDSDSGMCNPLVATCYNEVHPSADDVHHSASSFLNQGHNGENAGLAHRSHNSEDALTTFSASDQDSNNHGISSFGKGGGKACKCHCYFNKADESVPPPADSKLLNSTEGAAGGLPTKANTEGATEASPAAGDPTPADEDPRKDSFVETSSSRDSTAFAKSAKNSPKSTDSTSSASKTPPPPPKTEQETSEVETEPGPRDSTVFKKHHHDDNKQESSAVETESGSPGSTAFPGAADPSTSFLFTSPSTGAYGQPGGMMSGTGAPAAGGGPVIFLVPTNGVGTCNGAPSMVSLPQMYSLDMAAAVAVAMITRQRGAMVMGGTGFL